MHNIIFSGDLVAGFETEEVKANLGKLFKIEDTAKIDALFSGKDITLKKNLEPEQARKYEATLSKAGAMCRIDPPLHQFADEEEEEDLPPPTTSGASLNFNTIAMQTPAALALGDAPIDAAAAASDEPPRNKKKVAIMLVSVLAILLVGIVVAMQMQEVKKAEILEAAGDEDAQFERELEQVDDPELRETMRSLRELMKEADAIAEEYEQRDGEMTQADATATAADMAEQQAEPATSE